MTQHYHAKTDYVLDTVSRSTVVASLRWVMEQWLERIDDPGHEHIPDHACGFFLRPDEGYCSFHEEWFDAATLAGLMDVFAEEDIENGL